MQQGRRSVYYFWFCFASGKISQTADVGRTLIFFSWPATVRQLPVWSRTAAILGCGPRLWLRSDCKLCRGSPYPGLHSGNGGPGSIHAFYPLCCWWVWELGSENSRGLIKSLPLLVCKGPLWRSWRQGAHGPREPRTTWGGWARHSRHLLGGRAQFSGLEAGKGGWEGRNQSFSSLRPVPTWPYQTPCQRLDCCCPWYLLQPGHSWEGAASLQEGWDGA